MKIALIQLESQLNQYNGNLTKALAMVNKAAGAGAGLICLPEAFATSLDLANIDRLAEDLSGNIVKNLSEIARANKIYLCAGLLEKFNTQNYSSVVFISPNGVLLDVYRRIHIFEFEKRFLANGHNEVILDLPIGKIGIIIGYDINFPELCRRYFKEKVQLILCPSVIPIKQEYSVKQLIKARAIENNCYLAFISQVGYNIFANYAYMGGSMVVANPDFMMKTKEDYEEGEEVLCWGDDSQEQILYANIELDRLKKISERNPLYNDMVMEIQV